MIHFRCIRKHLCFIIFQISFISANFHKINYNSKYFKIGDLPLQKDLSKYLKTVELVTTYNFQNINEVDINLTFGIFLANVNLKRVLMDKEENIPTIIKIKLNNIVLKNEDILKYFQKAVMGDNYFVAHKLISKLFMNVSVWVDRLEDFVDKPQKNYNLKELQNVYSLWDFYLEDIDNVKKWIPSPKLSDMCLLSLSNSAIDEKDSQPRCPIDNSCYTMLNEGTNFGYALCHRSLLLLMAGLGRGCTVFSPEKDKALMDKYCAMGYAEAEYIAMNNYGIVDLMMEIMCLCSIHGHAQFLQRSWLRQILYFQKPQGCFGTEVTKTKMRAPLDRRGIYIKARHDNLSHDCNGHTTAVALVIFSSAIRYIIQEYY